MHAGVRKPRQRPAARERFRHFVVNGRRTTTDEIELSMGEDTRVEAVFGGTP